MGPGHNVEILWKHRTLGPSIDVQAIFVCCLVFLIRTIVLKTTHCGDEVIAGIKQFAHSGLSHDLRKRPKPSGNHRRPLPERLDDYHAKRLKAHRRHDGADGVPIIFPELVGWQSPQKRDLVEPRRQRSERSPMTTFTSDQQMASGYCLNKAIT